MADNTFTHVCTHRLISPSYLPQPKAKLHARKSAHTRAPSCTITLFEERDAYSPPAEALYVKASGVFAAGTEICGYVCQRVEEGRGIM